MKDDLDALRSAFAADADRVRAIDACPSADELWDGARGNLAAGRLAQLIDHTSACAACAEAWQLAVDVAGEPQAAAGASPAPVARRTWTWHHWAAVGAAAAAIAIAAVVFPRYLTRQSPSPTVVYRTDTTPPIRSLLSDGQVVSKNDVRLRWASAGEGVRYNVEIATEDLTVLDHAENLTATEHLVPQGALASLAPGTKLVWRVLATLPDGRQLRSPAWTLVIR